MIVPDRRVSWFRLLFAYQGSALPRIRLRLLAVLLVAGAVTAGDHYLALETDLSTIPLTLISVALGVLLGIRDNTSYDRSAATTTACRDALAHDRGQPVAEPGRW